MGRRGRRVRKALKAYQIIIGGEIKNNGKHETKYTNNNSFGSLWRFFPSSFPSELQRNDGSNETHKVYCYLITPRARAHAQRRSRAPAAALLLKSSLMLALVRTR